MSTSSMTINLPLTSIQCLAAIAQFHNLPIDPEQLVTQYQITNRELDCAMLIKMASDIGLRGRVDRIDWQQLLTTQENSNPLIARTTNGDYILIVGHAENETIAVIDPQNNSGTVTLVSREQLCYRWAGEVIFLQSFPSFSPANVLVVIPIYKRELDALETYSLEQSIRELSKRDIVFIGPENLDRSFYVNRFPGINFVDFNDQCFVSIQDYNRLLLSTSFYQRFNQYTFLLVLQTDAIVLRDELNFWCNQAFDYIGAPWPDGNELFVNIDRFSADKGRRVRAMVGNGGLSLRRLSACISLLKEFPEAVDYFNRSGSSEDLFFSFMGPLSTHFIMPSEMTASLFALEANPAFYYEINGGHPPMGGHAWWSADPQFWLNLLPNAPFTIQN